MSSAVLYLAIVAVWAIVLVPMWLRRDTETTGITRLLHKRADELDDEEDEPQDTDEPQAAPRPRRPVTRAAVIARRRRRTSGLAALLVTAVALVASGLLPWWATLPPALLLAGHLSLLRVAVGMDAARRRAAAEARAAARARAIEARRAEQDTEPAEVIELVTQEEVFDQYADDRRAVGE
ncbi:hypothetical protein F8568_036910 [Actinomadura sp. LD22]|uniref:Uncharacterized protein n=1 Tax=Actinomadura physcomitrii TaxID=2650748 RepID=A0A6I4MJK6_9ACTN|nr:hypothetical protein [Actinomadura physcomitrii]MWA05843.1 hypothetical protein [Actinomadura physcomitrii]